MRVYLLHSNEPTLHLLLERIHLPHGTQLPAQHAQSCIIHWGCFHAAKAGRLSFQPVKCMLRAASPRKSAELLKLHGIHLASESEKPSLRFSYEYLIPVFHLQALALFQKSQTVFFGSKRPLQKAEEPDFTEVLAETPSYHAVRAKREAVKAIYALGLDYGVVKVGVLPNGELVVLEVNAVPKLTDRLAELFAEAMHQLEQELAHDDPESRQEAMLGADPEFLLRNERGKVVFASNYMEKEGPIGCDAIVLPSFRKIYPLAELRPEPSKDIKQMIINLHRTMQMASRRITDGSLEWIAGGMPVRGFPLGGHIHFSGIPLSGELLRVLDNYLALPLVLLEDATTGNRKPQYGFLGDFRRQRHGGFEYRVLPSWMISPSIARGVLTMAKLIADHYRHLPARPLDEQDMQEAYYAGDKKAIRPLVPSLWGDLVRLRDFRQYEPYLIPLKNRLLRMESWNEQEDIRRNWKIGPFHRKEESPVNS
ncbi:hypothetical protein ACFQ88_01290 [Paenibacillus sp. NPDC056579]|uniref:putative amidoligase domain-containing protein n=1 Tax=unclassified Paenibacillus TaxID=185978 RepID=UPI001EF8993B|nr:hypothetical protein [Paenibacillus sp. H1-7]ULL15695.1 hypothetical protein DVH26_15310 [Paenibacillus sp. H1-7]